MELTPSQGWDDLFCRLGWSQSRERLHLSSSHSPSWPGMGREDFWVSPLQGWGSASPVLVPDWEGRRELLCVTKGNGEKSQEKGRRTSLLLLQVSRCTSQP